MTHQRTHYDILQVSMDAAPEVIAASRRALLSAGKKHPDVGGDEREAALINEACDVLLDPERRAIYDATLRAQLPRPVSPAGSAVERRRAPRKALDATVAFCFDHDLCWHPARVKDASVLGIRIQSHAPLMTGQHLVIAPGNRAAGAIHGTVKWTRMFHPTVFERIYEAGVEFADQISDVEQRLSV